MRCAVLFRLAVRQTGGSDDGGGREVGKESLGRNGRASLECMRGTARVLTGPLVSKICRMVWCAAIRSDARPLAGLPDRNFIASW